MASKLKRLAYSIAITATVVAVVVTVWSFSVWRLPPALPDWSRAARLMLSSWTVFGIVWIYFSPFWDEE